MKILLSIFIFFFSTSVLANYDKSEYKGKKALIDKQYSIDIGWNLEWLIDCANNFEVNKLKNQIKKISYADFKNVQKGIAEWRSGSGEASGCSQSNETIKGVEDYIISLKRLVSSQNKQNASNKSKINKKKLSFQKIIYENKTNSSLKDEYNGEFKNNKFHGIGKYTWRVKTEDEQTYIGNFEYGTIDGFGIEFIKNSDSFFCGRYLNFKSNNGILVYETEKDSKIGLGIEVIMQEGAVKVVAPIKDGPAFKAGILAGDLITHIDNKSVSGLNLKEAVNLMKGKKGQPIIITVSRDGVETFNVKILRDIYKTTSAKKADRLIGDFTEKGFGVLYLKNGNYIIGEWKKENTISYLNGYAVQYNNDGTIVEEGIYEKWDLIKNIKVSNAIITKARQSEKRAIDSCKRANNNLNLYNLNANENIIIQNINLNLNDSNHSKYIYCKDKYGVHKYLKGGNCYNNQRKISEEQFLDEATYCKKNNGEIYISQYNKCKSYEKKSTRLQHEKSINKNTSNSQNILKEFDFKINSISSDIIYLSNTIKSETDKIKKINISFSSSNSSQKINSREIFFDQEIDKIIKDIGNLEKEIQYLKVGNLIKDKINKNFKKLSDSSFSLYRLFTNYVNEYDKYIENTNKNKENTTTLGELKIVEEDNSNEIVKGIYYTTANANLRDQPLTQNSNIIVTIPKGEAVNVLRLAANREDWAQVRYNNQVGYIYLPLLSKEKTKAEITVTETLTVEDKMQLALDLLMKKKYSQSKKILNEFIKDHPNEPLSGSAHFWLALIYEFEQNYRMAAIVYGEGIDKFPNSIKAVEMYYKLSQVLVKLNKVSEACQTLALLNERYKNNKFITMAEESIAELNCTSIDNEPRENIEEIDVSPEEQVLVDVYYQELKKLFDLYEMELITEDDYNDRRKLVLYQIINLDLKSISIFLTKLFSEKLITEEEFKTLNKNNTSKVKDINEKEIKVKDKSNDKKNINISDMLKDLRNENTPTEIKNKNIELSIAEMDLVLQQLRGCFNPRAGTKIVGDEMVKISAKIDREANVRKDTVQIIATNISKNNPYYEAITESAVATLYNPLCSKLKLPLNKYESWKDLKITIDYSWIKN